MISKQCETCNKQFEVTEQFAGNKKCKTCYFNGNGNGNGSKPVVNSNRTDLSIGTQSIFKSLCSVRPKSVKVEKLS